MLETKCVGDNFKMLVTVLAFLVTNIHYLFTLASGTNIQKMSPTSKFSHQHPQIVPTLSHQHNDVTNITVTPQSPDCGIDFINGSTKTIYSTEQYYHEAKWSFPVVPYLPIFSPAKSNCQFLPVELSVTRT